MPRATMIPAPTSATSVLLMRSLAMNAYATTNTVIAMAVANGLVPQRHVEKARRGDNPVQRAFLHDGDQWALEARHDGGDFDDRVIRVRWRHVGEVFG